MIPNAADDASVGPFFDSTKTCSHLPAPESFA